MNNDVITIPAGDGGPKNQQSKIGMLSVLEKGSFNYCCFGPMTSTPSTAWDYFGENENRIILSYNINR